MQHRRQGDTDYQRADKRQTPGGKNEKVGEEAIFEE